MDEPTSPPSLEQERENWEQAYKVCQNCITSLDPDLEKKTKVIVSHYYHAGLEYFQAKLAWQDIASLFNPKKMALKIQIQTLMPAMLWMYDFSTLVQILSNRYPEIYSLICKGENKNILKLIIEKEALST